MEQPDRLAAALTYARHGWPVFPLEGKRPLTPHGFYDAVTDEQQIGRWWGWFPQANIGLPTGKWTGVIALDVDLPRGGWGSLLQLIKQSGPLPRTKVSRTGNGYHLLFHVNYQMKSQINWRAGLDIKWDGGYIVLPPSRHRNGRAYQWLTPPSLQIAPCPSGLLSSIQKDVPLPSPLSTSLEMSGDEWVRLACEKAQTGQRNMRGYWLAHRLREAGLSWSEASCLMRDYAACVPKGDHPYTIDEALHSLSSAWR